MTPIDHGGKTNRESSRITRVLQNSPKSERPTSFQHIVVVACVVLVVVLVLVQCQDSLYVDHGQSRGGRSVCGVWRQRQ